jgi:hypothetical protein
MRAGIIFAYMDNRHRLGRKYNGPVQPITGPLIAALLPADVEIEVMNDNSPDELDWTRDYDILFISSIHSDFDRARQISHYWRRRGAKTVYGGFMASTYPQLCEPFFDSVVIGDAEGCVRQILEDFRRCELKSRYISQPYNPLAVPVPRFDLARKNLIPLTLEATRGCPFRCEFCALTALGTRYHTRPPELVVRDIQEGQRMLRELVPWYQRRVVTFLDNNIGGDPTYLKALCNALERLDIVWGSQITFNTISDPEIVRALSRAGCRAMFVGLESFNPATLRDMHKYQNAIDSTKRMLEQSLRHGILIGSGLLISPSVDDMEYIDDIPLHLSECGFYMPSYVCFESPIPGTPNFRRLAAEDPPALLPNAMLRDFAGFTLVVRPKQVPVDEFINGYRRTLENVFTLRRKLTKFSCDLPSLLARQWWVTALCDVVNNAFTDDRPRSHRTYLAGTDSPPPEANSVPFDAEDFHSEAERRLIVEPMRVTNELGQVLPEWLSARPLYESKGRISERAVALAGPT